VVDLRDKLAYILNRPKEAEEVGIRAKKRVQKEYSWDSIARKTAETYKQTLEEKKHERHNVFKIREAK
jgi:glycosyltransferase involved in cell wall biosynthesis